MILLFNVLTSQVTLLIEGGLKPEFIETLGRLSCNLYDIKERALQADTDLRYNSYHPYHNYPVWNDRKLCHHHPMSHCDWLHKNTIETL